MKPKMKPKKKLTFPRTAFQRWLANHGACPPARKAVGKKTLQEAWRTTRSASWMRWFLTDRWPYRWIAYKDTGNGWPFLSVEAQHDFWNYSCSALRRLVLPIYVTLPASKKRAKKGKKR